MNSSLHHSINTITDLYGELKLTPETTKLFLKLLLKQYIRVAFWSQSIIKTSKPRSGVLPLPIRFTLQLEHRLDSNEMH